LLGATVLLGLSAAATATLLTDWNGGGPKARATARKHRSARQRFVDLKLDIGFPKRAEVTFALKGQF
jgi:hypothetical protein